MVEFAVLAVIMVFAVSSVAVSVKKLSEIGVGKVAAALELPARHAR
jgi:hypothetical protein